MTSTIEVDTTATAVVNVTVLPGCHDCGTAQAVIYSTLLDLSDGARHPIDHYLETLDLVVQCWANGELAGLDVFVVDGNRIEVQGTVSTELTAVRVVVVGRLA